MSRGSARGAQRTVAHSYDSARRAHIEDIQRVRMLAAAVEVAVELGAANARVSDIVGRTGVSRRTFYELFVDREACYVAAFERGLGALGERIGKAYQAERTWQARTRAGLIALLVFVEEQPSLARFLLFESQSAGAKVTELRARAVEQLVEAIDRGRNEPRASALVPPLSAEGIVGGALAVLQTRMQASDREPLLLLVNQLMYMIVLPYLGAAAAGRELSRPTPSAPSAPKKEPSLRSDPFSHANVRLTYRTVTVLTAVADRPGASNREIGDASGIGDQGQISKLLARLERNGVVENTAPKPRNGGPNAWTLTEGGRQAVENIRAHAGTDRASDR